MVDMFNYRWNGHITRIKSQKCDSCKVSGLFSQRHFAYASFSIFYCSMYVSKLTIEVIHSRTADFFLMADLFVCLLARLPMTECTLNGSFIIR